MCDTRHVAAFAALLGSMLIAVAPAAAESLRSVTVGPSEVDRLYEEILVEGTDVYLEKGTYKITQLLPLAANVRLIGVNTYIDADGDGVWDPRPQTAAAFADPLNETIIDCDGLPQGATAIMCASGNEVRGLTVRSLTALPGPRPHLIGATSDGSAVRGGGLNYAVRDVICDGGQLGISNAHNGSVFADFDSTVEIERCVTRNARGGGIFFANAFASGARWNGLVRHNRSYANNLGLALNSAGLESDHGEVAVVSSGNIFEGNVFAGVLIQGAWSPGGTGNPSENRTHWSSHGDAFWNNNSPAFFGGGIFVTGASPGTNNHVRLNVIGGRFVKRDAQGNPDGPQNQFQGARRDVWLVGGTGPLASGNRVVALARDSSSDGADGAFMATSGVNVSNEVTVIGSDVAFTHANDDVDLPPGGFFGGGDE